MSNSTAPSDFIAEIYRKDDFEKAVAVEMELVDLWDEFREFWYCQECKRITVIDRKIGNYACSYSRKKLATPVLFETIRDWQELLYWRDQEFYDAIEESVHRTVGDFVKFHPSRYNVRISPDFTLVHVFASRTGEYLFSYVLDETPDFARNTPYGVSWLMQSYTLGIDSKMYSGKSR